MSASPDVSRETRSRLQGLLTLLDRWNRTINLVSTATLTDSWNRHILDSAQLHRLTPNATKWLDLGSGGGFPGLVIAILAEEFGAPKTTTLVESDLRKAAFLQTACRELDVTAQIIASRAETVEPHRADVVSARAVAPLDRLLGLAHHHLAPGGKALFPKGSNYKREIEAASQKWQFSTVAHESMTNPAAIVLEIGDIRRA